MTKEAEATTPESSTDAKLTDALGIREEFAADDALPAATTKPAEEATAATAQSQDEKDLAAALPELTPEQIAQLAENPAVVEAVLGSKTGQSALDILLQQLTEQNARTVAERAVQAKEAATFEEAIKKGQEEGDWSDFGKLTAESLLKKAEDDKVHKEAMGTVVRDLDDAVERVYGDVIDNLTQEELNSLARGNFRSDVDFMTAVLKTFDSKRTEMVRSEAGSKASEATAADEAAKLASAAATARSKAGLGAIPGGTGVESKGDSVGDLIREALRGDLASIEE